MRVILTHDLTNHTGRLAVGAVIGEIHLVHGMENAPMHRLQAVAHIGQRAAHDHAHGIIKIRPLHFLDNGNRLNAAWAAVWATIHIVGTGWRRLI
ncbi:Uncharacterised protein [Brucella suis]|nr:Uncharacterised protein [Brucella suis]